MAIRSAVDVSRCAARPVAIALTRVPQQVYGENVRMIVPIDTEAFGRVYSVHIGAMMVGSA